MLPADTKQHYRRRTQVSEETTENEDTEVTLDHVHAATAEIGATIQKQIAEIAEGGGEQLDPLAIYGLQLGHWVQWISDTMEHGDQWMAAGELAWAQTLKVSLEQFITDHPPASTLATPKLVLVRDDE